MSSPRRARPDDLGSLLELHRSFCLSDGHRYHPQAAERALRPLLEDDTLGVVWLVEGSVGRGYAVITWGWSISSGGRDALIDEIYAEPPGSGVGSLLLERLLADLDERRIPTVFLETELANAAARRLYARFGFETEDSIWMSRRADGRDDD